MWKEIDVAGIFVTPVISYMVVALAIHLAIRPLLMRVGLQGWVWDPALAELCVYVCILTFMVSVL